MPVTINDKTYYRTAEVCQIVGISKNTLFRWLKDRILKEPELRDRREWRLFTEIQIDRLKQEATRIHLTQSKCVLTK